jgi:carbamoyl-phosphate synthase small subunit
VIEQLASETRSTGEVQPVATYATLLLADGTCIRGQGLGAPGSVSGELIFTTAMTGYREALTDPSYRGQILMFTYPLIGNYGVAAGRAQSGEVHTRAAILATLSDGCSESDSLRVYLLASGVPTMYGVDTRAIAKHIRRQGAMPAVLSLHTEDREPARSELEATLHACAYDASDFVAEVTVALPEIHGKGRRLVALLDCGNKRSVIDELVSRDTQVVVLPAWTPATEILALAPDGLVLSNGPGNPAAATTIVETIRQLYGQIPLFGICLGHQLLALAAGGRTYKLRFGHRGANHPVQDCATGRAFVTTQNHGYAVDGDSLPPELRVSHRNLNDGTVEGLRHRALPIRSLQFHPEGAPGPRDAGVMLDEWLGELS